MILNDFLSEKWSQKYKRSIDCTHPKGFSQKAHCAGRRKNEDLEENLRDWFGKGKAGGAGGGGWDRYNTKGERIGKCGDRKPGEGKPKCLSKSRAASLRASGGKAAIAAAVRRKRSQDKNPDRSGSARNVPNRSRADESANTIVEYELKHQPKQAAVQGVFDFYRDTVGNAVNKPVDNYVDQARELLQQTRDPSVREKLVKIFAAGKKNPYIQGSIITTVSALLAGGLFTHLQQLHLSPQQMNIIFQAVLNTVIPTLVSKMHGKSWKETLKYTLASAGIGTAVAAVSEDNDKDLETRLLQKQLRAQYPQAKDLTSAMALDYFKTQKQDRRDISRLDQENDQEEADIDRLDRENDQEEAEINRLKRIVNQLR